MQFILYTNHTFCDHDIIITIAQKLAPASSFSKATRKFVKCSGSPRKLQPQDTRNIQVPSQNVNIDTKTGPKEIIDKHLQIKIYSKLQ